jgi:hypothetical protein
MFVIYSGDQNPNFVKHILFDVNHFKAYIDNAFSSGKEIVISSSSGSTIKNLPNFSNVQGVTVVGTPHWNRLYFDRNYWEHTDPGEMGKHVFTYTGPNYNKRKEKEEDLPHFDMEKPRPKSSLGPNQQ